MKKQFPFFDEYPYFVYADSAATTLKPKTIIDAIALGYKKYTLPAGKSIYKEAEITYDETEIKTKRKIADLVKSSSNYDIFFGFSVTILFEKLFSLLKNQFKKDNNIVILLPRTTHNAIIFPLETYFQTKISYSYYETKEELFEKKHTADIVIIPVIDHITGKMLHPEEINNLKKEMLDSIFVVDASQSFAFFPYSLKDSSIDFMLWSSHKMYGPDGVAIIMIHKEAIHKILIANQKNTVKMLSHYYKGGSFSYPSIFAFQETIDWIDNTIYKKKEYKEKKIYFIQHIIKAIKEQNLYLCSDENSMHIVSFYSQHIHAHDIALLFSEKNIGIRSGDLCASHFHQKKGICRISLGAYTDEEDIEKIIATIKTI